MQGLGFQADSHVPAKGPQVTDIGLSVEGGLGFAFRRRNKRLSPQQVEDIVQEYLEHFERESDEGKARERKARKTAARRKSLGRTKSKLGSAPQADQAAETAGAAAAPAPAAAVTDAAGAPDAAHKLPELRHIPSASAAAASATETREEQQQLLPARSGAGINAMDRRQQLSSACTDIPAVQGYQEYVPRVYALGFRVCCCRGLKGGWSFWVCCWRLRRFPC